ncbi:MAG: urea carboxylase-associated family protein [Alphaproteobacteria bacterium]|nr:urea carboxylase-associated family protein [Alphaproteobacteria bacterium]
MTKLQLVTIPARKGKASFAAKGQHVRIVNTHGNQVVDTWAFNRADLGEFMSMEHTRAQTAALFWNVGDTMLSNRRRPLLTILSDTSPGIHDSLCAACDRYRYQLLGCKEHHDNCTDNLHDAMAELGLVEPETPSPWNLFMNIPIRDGRKFEFLPTVSKPGDYVEVRAEMDCVVAFSACPQDIVPINGGNPVEAHFAVFDPR